MSRGYKGTLVVTAAALALNALTIFAQGHFLGPESRGIIAAIFNLPNLAFIVGSFGLTNAAGYFAGRKPEEAGGIVVTLSVVLAIWSIPFTLAIYLALPWYMKQHLSAHTEHLASIFLLSIPLQFLNNGPQAALQGVGRLKVWNTYRLLPPLTLFLVTVLAFVLPGDKLSNLVYMQLATLVVLVLITWGIVVFTFPRPFRSAYDQLPQMFRYGIPSGLTTLPAQLNLRVDQVLMVTVVSAQILGVYSLSVAWAQLVVPIFAAMGQVLFPRLVAQTLRSEQYRSIYDSVEGALGLGLILAAGLIVTSYWILPTLFGPLFRVNYTAVVVLIVANIFAGMNQLLGDAFRGMGETRPPMWAEGSGFCMTLILLWPLVINYGALGAAIVSFLAYATTTIVLLLSLMNKHHLSIAELIRPRLPVLTARRAREGGS